MPSVGRRHEATLTGLIPAFLGAQRMRRGGPRRAQFLKLDGDWLEGGGPSLACFGTGPQLPVAGLKLRFRRVTLAELDAPALRSSFGKARVG